MVEPARASCNRGESVEFVETYLLHPRLFAIMLRSRGDDVAGPKGGGQSIRKYLAKLASNNLGSMTKRLKSTSLLDFLSSEMQGKFLEGVAGIRRALIDAGNPDIRPKPYISNLRHMQIVGITAMKNRLPLRITASTKRSWKLSRLSWACGSMRMNTMRKIQVSVRAVVSNDNLLFC